MKKKFEKAKQSASRLMGKLNPGRRSHSRSPNQSDSDPDPDASSAIPSVGTHEYSDPKAPQTALGTTGSIANEFLAAARDGADMFLPLKAALVGAVKIFEICEATKILSLYLLDLIGLIQRTAEVSEQYQNLKSRVAHLGAVTGALSKRSQLDPSLVQRLHNIAE